MALAGTFSHGVVQPFQTLLEAQHGLGSRILVLGVLDDALLQRDSVSCRVDAHKAMIPASTYF